MFCANLRETSGQVVRSSSLGKERERESRGTHQSPLEAKVVLQVGVCEYSVLVLQSTVAPHGRIRNGSQSTSELVLVPGYPYARHERRLGT